MKLKSSGKFINILQFAFGWKKYTNRNLWEKIIPLLGIKAAASFRLKYKYWPFTWHRKSDYFMHSVTYGDSFMHLDVCLGRLCQSMDLYMYIYGTCISLYFLYNSKYVLEAICDTVELHCHSNTMMKMKSILCIFFSKRKPTIRTLCKNLERRFYHDMFNRMLCYKV